LQPALPPGLNAEKIRARVTLDLQQMRHRGWEAEHARFSLMPVPGRPRASVGVMDVWLSRCLHDSSWSSYPRFAATQSPVHRPPPIPTRSDTARSFKISESTRHRWST